MSTSNWQSNTAPGGSSQEYSFVMSTTLDGFSYTPSEAERSRDAAQVVATGRKSWKTLKGIGEAVWPPQLEAALIEALKKYDLENSGKNDKSQRYPKRNRFIADYIYETTKKRRHPKQVGSRLQQLRDTCKNETILRLVKPRGSAQRPGTRASSEDSGSSSSSVADPRSPRASLSSQPLLDVVISLQDQLFPAPLPTISISNNGFDRVIQLSPSINAASSSAGQSTNNLRYLSRVIELVSPVPLELETTFSVYQGDSSQALHFEEGVLRCVPYSSGRSGWVYRSELVPSFWESLCFIQGQDITNFKILQRLTLSASNNVTATAIPETVGVMYTFSVPSSTLPRRSSAPSIGVSRHGESQSLLHAQAQPLSYSSQGMQSAAASALNYPSYPAAVVPDNLEDNWMPNLTSPHSRSSPHLVQHHHHPMAAEPRSVSQATSYYGAESNYHMDRGQRAEYLPTGSSFPSSYPADTRSGQSIHAPVPVPHQQHFNPYHPYSHL